MTELFFWFANELLFWFVGFQVGFICGFTCAIVCVAKGWIKFTPKKDGK